MRTWLLVAVVACGPSNAEVKTAKEASYNADLDQMIDVAKQAIEAEYKVGGVNRGGCTVPEGECTAEIATVPRFYGPEGDLHSVIGESNGTEYVRMPPGTVESILIVALHRTAAHTFVVEVIPKTFQIIGTPKPRELGPDDPYLPAFIHGRVDTLAARIYDLGKKYVAAAPGQ